MKDDHDFSSLDSSEFIHRLSIEKELLEDSFDSLDELSETISEELELVKVGSTSTACSDSPEVYSPSSPFIVN